MDKSIFWVIAASSFLMAMGIVLILHPFILGVIE